MLSIQFFELEQTDGIIGKTENLSLTKECTGMIAGTRSWLINLTPRFGTFRLLVFSMLLFAVLFLWRYLQSVCEWVKRKHISLINTGLVIQK